MKQVYEVLYAPEVYQDIQDILDYFYHTTSDIELGERFLKSVKKARTTLKRAPLQYQIRYDRIRFFQIHPFSHILHFKVDEVHNIIRIVAIFHSSDDPKKWVRH